VARRRPGAGEALAQPLAIANTGQGVESGDDEVLENVQPLAIANTGGKIFVNQNT
jgi:hypothetical protein